MRGRLFPNLWCGTTVYRLLCKLPKLKQDPLQTYLSWSIFHILQLRVTQFVCKHMPVSSE